MKQDFNDMALEKGLVAAFHFYAADDGVIGRYKRGDWRFVWD